MSNVAKIVEISSASEVGIEDAVKRGIEKVAETLDHIQGAWVSDIKVLTDRDGKVTEWRVHLRVTFVVD